MRGCEETDRGANDCVISPCFCVTLCDVTLFLRDAGHRSTTEEYSALDHAAYEAKPYGLKNKNPPGGERSRRRVEDRRKASTL